MKTKTKTKSKSPKTNLKTQVVNSVCEYKPPTKRERELNEIRDSAFSAGYKKAKEELVDKERKASVLIQQANLIQQAAHFQECLTKMLMSINGQL